MTHEQPKWFVLWKAGGKNLDPIPTTCTSVEGGRDTVYVVKIEKH